MAADPRQTDADVPSASDVALDYLRQRERLLARLEGVNDAISHYVAFGKPVWPSSTVWHTRYSGDRVCHTVAPGRRGSCRPSQDFASNIIMILLAKSYAGMRAAKRDR